MSIKATIEIPQEEVDYKDGVPCGHPGCLSHVSHPCEGCGRIGGRVEWRELTYPGPRTIMIPQDVDTPPPPQTKAPGWRHQEPVSPRAFGEAVAQKKKGRKE